MIEKEGNEKTADFIKRVVPNLKSELEKYNQSSFRACKNMGEILDQHLELMLLKDKWASRPNETLTASELAQKHK